MGRMRRRGGGEIVTTVAKGKEGMHSGGRKPNGQRGICRALLSLFLRRTPTAADFRPGIIYST